MEALDDLLSESDGELGLSPNLGRNGFGDRFGRFGGPPAAGGVDAGRVAPGALPGTPGDASLGAMPPHELGLGLPGRYADPKFAASVFGRGSPGGLPSWRAGSGLQQEGGLREEEEEFDEDEDFRKQAAAEDGDGGCHSEANVGCSVASGEGFGQDQDEYGAFEEDYGDDADFMRAYADVADIYQRLLQGHDDDLDIDGAAGVAEGGADLHNAEVEEAEEDDEDDALLLNMHAETYGARARGDRVDHPRASTQERPRIDDDDEEMCETADGVPPTLWGEQSAGGRVPSPSRLGQIKSQARKLLGEFSRIYETSVDDENCPPYSHDVDSATLGGATSSQVGNGLGRAALRDNGVDLDVPWYRRKDNRATDLGQVGVAATSDSAGHTVDTLAGGVRLPASSSAQTTADGGASDTDGDMEADGMCRSPSHSRTSPPQSPCGSVGGGDSHLEGNLNTDAARASSSLGLFEDEFAAHSTLIMMSSASPLASPCQQSKSLRSPSVEATVASGTSFAKPAVAAATPSKPALSPTSFEAYEADPGASGRGGSPGSLVPCFPRGTPAVDNAVGQRPPPLTPSGTEAGSGLGATATPTGKPSVSPSPSASTAPSPSAGKDARPRTFLKKGARMPRSEMPRSGSRSEITTKPINNPPARRPSLKLQPRASSEPAAARSDTSAVGNPDVEYDRPSQTPPAEPASSSSHRSAGAGVPPDFAEAFGAPARAASSKLGAAQQRAQQQMAALQQMAAKGSNASDFGDLDGDVWAESAPWDCHDLELELGLDEEEDPSVVGSRSTGYAAPSFGGSSGSASVPLAGDPPTSRIVKSYFAPSRGSGAAPPAKEVQPPQPPQPPRQPTNGSGRHSHWEGGDAYSTLYGCTAGSAAGSPPNRKRQQHPSVTESDNAGVNQVAAGLEQEARHRIAALDQQIKRYENEVEIQKKLQAQAEQMQRDLAREREKLLREVEAEKQAMRAEVDNERSVLKRERRRLIQGAERQRQQTAEEREAAEERRRLRERNDQLEEESKEKDKRWQRTVDRLNRQIADLTGKNRELQEEVKRANQQAQQALEAPVHPRRSSSVTSARGRRPSVGPSASSASGASGVGNRGPSIGARTSGVSTGPASHDTPSTAFAPVSRPSAANRDSSRTAAFRDTARRAPDASQDATVASAHGLRAGAFAEAVGVGDRYGRDRGVPPVREKIGGSSGDAGDVGSQEVQEVRSLDGRTERIYKDGRREVEFANGLKKVVWADGRTSVWFQNGDRKEIHTDGVVVYHYCATGAVQTTLPDGEELYHFVDGQFERHSTDGSKEIKFPNGTSKRIFTDGSEEVRFADGSVRTTPPQ